MAGATSAALRPARHPSPSGWAGQSCRPARHQSSRLAGGSAGGSTSREQGPGRENIECRILKSEFRRAQGDPDVRRDRMENAKWPAPSPECRVLNTVPAVPYGEIGFVSHYRFSPGNGFVSHPIPDISPQRSPRCFTCLRKMGSFCHFARLGSASRAAAVLSRPPEQPARLGSFSPSGYPGDIGFVSHRRPSAAAWRPRTAGVGPRRLNWVRFAQKGLAGGLLGDGCGLTVY